MQKLALVLTGGFFLSLFFYAGIRYESKDAEGAGTEKALVDTTIDLHVSRMSDAERNQYTKRMLKPLEVDSGSRVVPEDKAEPCRRTDEQYQRPTDSGRLEEERMRRELTCSKLELDYYMYELCINSEGAFSGQ